jgi:hypothetical protein
MSSSAAARLAPAITLMSVSSAAGNLGNRGFAALARYFAYMGAQRNGERTTPAVVELGARSGAARAHPVVGLPRDDRLPDPLVDELADKLSNRLAGRLADQLVERIAAVAIRNQEDRDRVPRIPEGAKYATSEQLAVRYQVSIQWVESRAADLGATPISDSANSKLRYHLVTADAYMDARRRQSPATVRRAGGRKPKPTKRTHSRTGRPLLDVE